MPTIAPLGKLYDSPDDAAEAAAAIGHKWVYVVGIPGGRLRWYCLIVPAGFIRYHSWRVVAHYILDLHHPESISQE